MKSSSILSENTKFSLGATSSDPRYRIASFKKCSGKTGVQMQMFLSWDRLLTPKLVSHPPPPAAERSKTNKRKRKEKQTGRERKKEAKKERHRSFFLFLMSSDQEKFCRWQKIRFHGQVAEIALLISQPPARLPGAEIKKNNGRRGSRHTADFSLLFGDSWLRW